MRFQCNISLPLGRMDAHQHVEFTGGAELAVLVEKAVTDLVKKAVAGRSGGEGRREAWWRERRDGEEGERERTVKREVRWREGGQKARWRWWVGCAAKRGRKLTILRLVFSFSFF